MMPRFRSGRFYSLVLFLAATMVPNPTDAQRDEPSSAFPYERQFVETGEARIAYVDSGDADGAPILFLHGIPTSSYLWRNVLPGVEADDRRLIALDWVGFGQSEGTGYGILEQAEHLEAFVEALALDDLTLVTHDWGAGIGLIFAERNPERVAAFATMEGALPPVYPRPDLASFGPAAPLFERMRNPATAVETVLIDNVWIETILPNSVLEPLPPATEAAYREPFPTAESRRPILDMVLSLPIGGEPADVVGAYEEATTWWRATPIPKLVLYATPGRLQPERLAVWAEENLANVTTAEVGPGVHFIQEDSPDGITRALDAWLKTINDNDQATLPQPDTGALAAARDNVDRLVGIVAAELDDQTSPFGLIVRLRAKPPYLDDVLASYAAQTEAAARNSGSLAYHVGQDIEDPAALLLYEWWQDFDAFVAHETSAITIAHFARVASWLEAERSLEVVVAVSPHNKPSGTAIDLDNLEYRANPIYKGVETAVVYGDRNTSGLYTTHARVSDGARIPPHTHPNTLTTWVTSGTAYVGTGETFDEDALVAYPAGTFFVTPAGSPHFIAAMEGDFSILDHGSGPTAFTLIGEE